MQHWRAPISCSKLKYRRTTPCLRTASATNHLAVKGRERFRSAVSTALFTQRPAIERSIREDRSFGQPVQLKVPSTCSQAKPRGCRLPGTAEPTDVTA